MDLHSEFTRRCHDERHGPFHTFKRPLVLEMTEQRQEERDGLAGTGLCNADNVAAGHNGWNSLGLDRRWPFEVEATDDVETITVIVSNRFSYMANTHQLAGRPQ